MEWDDLRYFLELARSGTLTEAARRLEVKHTTVSRRIQRLEMKVGGQLFTRTPMGHVPTRRGENLISDIQGVEETIRNISANVPKDAEHISGLVRIGCTEGYGTGIIPPHLSVLQSRHPLLLIDLIVQPRPIHLARKEADIVITIDRPERGPYLITKLVDYELRLYASRAYLAANPPINTLADLQAHRFVSYLEESGPARNLPWIHDLVQSPVSVRSTSIVSQVRMVGRNAGIAILPSFLVEGHDDLVPVLGDSICFKRTYWMLMPTELQHIPRIQIVWQTLKQLAKEEAPRLSQLAHTV